MNTNKRYWFGRKKIGWGFGPRTWEGWLTAVVWAVLMMTLPSFVGQKLGHPWAVMLSTALIVAFFVIFFWKLERPRSE